MINANKREIFDIAKADNLVAICYSTWFDPVIKKYGKSPKNIAEILDGKDDWAEIGEFHYWGKPALGYYSSTDKSIIRKHMIQLRDAGIDFIIVDNTNASLSWKEAEYWDDMVENPCIALLDTVSEMRREGLNPPHVAMWCRTQEGWGVTDEVYRLFYTEEKYADSLVYRDGKPFFITTSVPEEENEKNLMAHDVGLNYHTAPGEWSFLQLENSPNFDENGNPEQICVCTAAQCSYMTDTDLALGRKSGKTFWHQWQKAFESHPKIVTITWWNEWIAQRFEENRFVDNYTEEYSRDIEPMEGGHGDKYYNWMKKYISDYKSGKECPELHD